MIRSHREIFEHLLFNRAVDLSLLDKAEAICSYHLSRSALPTRKCICRIRNLGAPAEGSNQMGHPNTEREIVLANISMALSLLGIRVVTTRRWQHADKSGRSTNHETTARLQQLYTFSGSSLNGSSLVAIDIRLSSDKTEALIQPVSR